MRRLLRRLLPPRQRAMLVTGTAHKVPGPPTVKRSLAATAAPQIGAQLDMRFRRYVAWLDHHGYAFGSCNDLPLQFDRPRVYLRYDVHVVDLLAAIGLARLHEELQIPGSFQIFWQHSQAEVDAADQFLKLQDFDSRFVEFGLHCSPESSWIIADSFAGRSEALEKFIAAGGGDRLIGEWLQAYQRDGHDAPVLQTARHRAEQRFAQIAASFRRHFGQVKTTSGHGTSLSTAYLRQAAAEPRLAALAPYLHPVDFLTPERLRRHGFLCELTRFDENALPGPPIMFENPIGDMAARYRQRMSHGGGFVVLFHPASWAGDHLVPFLDEVTAPDRLAGDKPLSAT
jgi:hypothetical protein